MTESEASMLERLCDDFSALSDENKLIALTVSKTLLTVQQSVAPENEEQYTKADKSTLCQYDTV
jgi:hypothetical protein